MRYDFDRTIDRRQTDSSKWRHFEPDVLSLWTADMDFESPRPVVEALHERVAHGVFGYAVESDTLREAVVERMRRLYGWSPRAEAVIYQTGVVHGLHAVCRLVGDDDAILFQTPVYPPIHAAPAHTGRLGVGAVLTRLASGRYEIDFDRLEAAIRPSTRLFILCNPHNPVGRVFERRELERLAAICLRHDLLICSDEIHADLVFGESTHVPIASLSPEVAARTITLVAPSKTYNLAGLRCSFAIAEDETVRRRLQGGREGREFAEVNSLGQVAALAAYRDGQDWLEQVLAYLQANRDHLTTFVRSRLPGIETWPAEGTYLAWLDCRGAGLDANPYDYFLRRARVGLQDGAWFGGGGSGFVRLNFGCPRATLDAALVRMQEAIASNRG